MVADDSATGRDIIRIVLLEHGYRVMTAASGNEADHLIQSSNLDLLVLDNQMAPGPLGLELCAKYSGQLPVLMLSGDDIEQAAIAAGATAFIPRPVLPHQVMSVIRHLEAATA